jgi:hypothetical protein
MAFRIHFMILAVLMVFGALGGEQASATPVGAPADESSGRCFIETATVAAWAEGAEVDVRIKNITTNRTITWTGTLAATTLMNYWGAVFTRGSNEWTITPPVYALTLSPGASVQFAYVWTRVEAGPPLPTITCKDAPPF